MDNKGVIMGKSILNNTPRVTYWLFCEHTRKC